MCSGRRYREGTPCEGRAERPCKSEHKRVVRSSVSTKVLPVAPMFTREPTSRKPETDVFQRKTKRNISMLAVRCMGSEILGAWVVSENRTKMEAQGSNRSGAGS